MKTLYALFLVLFVSLLHNAFAFGPAYINKCPTVVSSCSGCVSSFCQVDNPCACTDPGWRENDCISKSVYCKAFGNVGGLED